MKKFAFTLAEVLITLGVIGIVAAITIPNIMTGYQKKVQVAALQRTYNEVQNAIVKYMADNGVEKLSESGLNNNSGNVQSFMSTYLKPVNYSTNPGDYFVSTYPQVNGSNNGHGYIYYDLGWSGTRYCAKLRSGTSVCMSTYNPSYGRISVILDTNGKDKPNITGRDYFAFSILNDGTVGTAPGWSVGPNAYNCYNPEVCFGIVMKDGWEMKY